MGAFNLRFGGPQSFAPALQLVARTSELLNGFNARWAARYDFPTTYRKPPKTLRPRKGAPPRQETIAEVIRLFIEQRDMFAMDDAALQAVGQTVIDGAIDALRNGGAVPNAGALMLKIVNAQKQLVIRRWEAGGGDLSLKPLSADYVRYKARLGYPTRIGTLTGQSLAALRKVRVVAVKL